jgi:acyl carrier protein
VTDGLTDEVTDGPATGSDGAPLDRSGLTTVILDIVAKETGVERARLQPEARIADLEIPSLDMVQTIFELESRFDIEIPVIAERSGAEFDTVGALVEHVLTTIDHSTPKGA